ncbi:origin recognition complex, subunit 2 [Flagelloscypha sp. PMI_526]|nr:origin recognition complex, subunit 2 [Flagelloscypha sp. PMI_526]
MPRPILSSAKSKRPAESSRYIVPTSFDAYLTQNSTKQQTSDSIFTDLIAPLSAEEYAESPREALFNRIMLELISGFNVIGFGFGSKRNLLNELASSRCARAGHVVLVNGFKPDFTLKDIFASIHDHIPGFSESPDLGASLESQTRRVYDFFASPDQKRRLFLVIHNLDSHPFRSAKAKSSLSSLALNPRIHIVASVDHIHSPLLWSVSEASTRKDERDPSHGKSARGFAWLWHDMTTLESYDFELSFVNRTALDAAHGGGPRKKSEVVAAAGGATGAAVLSESAVSHILASVTQKAKRLFVMIGTTQLANIDDAPEAAVEPHAFALGYDKVFNDARSDFIATNETALRSLLGEFKDHGLILTAPAASGGSEILWIAMRKERLKAVLDTLTSSS